jgi:hypothetical protein
MNKEQKYYYIETELEREGNKYTDIFRNQLRKVDNGLLYEIIYLKLIMISSENNGYFIRNSIFHNEELKTYTFECNGFINVIEEDLIDMQLAFRYLKNLGLLTEIDLTSYVVNSLKLNNLNISIIDKNYCEKLIKTNERLTKVLSSLTELKEGKE